MSSRIKNQNRRVINLFWKKCGWIMSFIVLILLPNYCYMGHPKEKKIKINNKKEKCGFFLIIVPLFF